MEQLAQRLRESVAVASRAEHDATEAAKFFSTASEKRDDSRAALEFGGMSAGQRARVAAAREELAVLTRFYERPPGPQNAVAPGALVDIAIDGAAGTDERTFIVLPVGAGEQLLGPGGDGFITVITPASPVGRALMGKQPGDEVDVTVRGEDATWTIVDVA